MKADIRLRLEAAIREAPALGDRVLISELIEMMEPLGIRRQQVSASVGALKIDAKAHGRRGSHRVASVSAEDAERMIGWLLETRRAGDD